MSTSWRLIAVLLAAPLFFSAPANSVSFDCSTARTADQKAICGNDLASELDDIASRGYRYLKSRLGKKQINQLNRQILQYRQRCGGDVDCIIAVQVEAIRIFKELGAPISLPGRTASPEQTNQAGTTGTASTPSFDCSKAALPDEKAICRSPELAALDQLTTEGYRNLKAARGKEIANRVGRAFLKERRLCGGDAACIREAQASAIAAYRTAAETGVAASGAHAASSSPAINQDQQNLTAREQFKPEPYEMMNFDWSRDNGRPVIIGTVASADAMCGVLAHPLFSHSAEVLSRLGTMNGSPKIDPDNLASRWLNDRASEYALNVRDRGWIPTEPTDRTINANLAACLKLLQERAPSAYDNVTRLFITSLSGKPPCFGQEVMRIKKLNADGVLVETEMPRVNQNLKCADFSYDTSIQRGEGTRNADVSDSLFLAALSLREAHKALLAILDKAQASLAALHRPEENTAGGQEENASPAGSGAKLTQGTASSSDQQAAPGDGQSSIFDEVADEISSKQSSTLALSNKIETEVFRAILSGEGRSFEVTSIQSLRKFSSVPEDERLEDAARRADWYVNDERQSVAVYQGRFNTFHNRENAIVVSVESRLGRELLDSIATTMREAAVEKRSYDASKSFPFDGWAKSFNPDWDGLIAMANDTPSVDVYAFKNIQDPKYSIERKVKRNPEGLSAEELLRKALRRSIYIWQYRDFADEYAPVLPNLRVRFMDGKNAVIEEYIVKRWDANDREACPRTADNSSCPKYASADGVIHADRDWTNLDGPCFLQPTYFNCAVIMPVSRFNIYIDRDPKTLLTVKRIDFSLVPN